MSHSVVDRPIMQGLVYRCKLFGVFAATSSCSDFLVIDSRIAAPFECDIFCGLTGSN